MKVLILAAHPDDDILGMGGTILKHSQKGDEIKIIYFATGIASRKKYLQQSYQKEEIEKEILQLRTNAKKAAKILKVDTVLFHDFPDNELDSIPLLKIVKVIENEIEKFKPNRIYTNHYNDLNVDHRIIYNATLTAARPIENGISEIISFEVPSSTEWNYPNRFNPNYFVSIDNQLKEKILAFEMFEGEIRKFPHPRSSKSLQLNAERWGTVSGNLSAEAFEIIRKIEK